MANKRDTAQQKRARQNRAQRAALQARTQGAPKRPSRVAPSTAEKVAARAAATKASSASGSGSEATSGNRKRQPRERPPRPGDTPVDVTALEGSYFRRVNQVPGGNQVIMAAILAVIVTCVVPFLTVFSSDAAIEAGKRLDKPPKLDQTLFQANGTVRGIIILAVPLFVVAACLHFAFHPRRRSVWTVSAVVMFVLVALQVQLYLVVVMLLGYAVYRSYKVEGSNRPRGGGPPEEDPEDLDASAVEEDGGSA